MKRVDFLEKNQLFEKRCKELEDKERQMDFAKRELESKQKQLDDRIRELELKEKQFANIIQIRVGADQSERNSPSLDLRFLVTMFGKGLQLFLNEHVKYHDSIAGKVLEALKQCTDPAKLVLDAMEGFYPPHLKKGNFEFGGSVVRRSCILLLEQIMKISPAIHTDVKEAALGIAAEWKAKMKPVVENWLEVLGFLSLLAAYELGGDFDVDVLLNLYKIIPRHRQTPEIFVLLGFADEIDDFVKGIAHVNTKEGNTEVGISKINAAKTTESATSRGEKRKRGRPPKRSLENTVEFNKKAVTLDSGAKKYNVIDDSESKPNLGSTSNPEVHECPDPEFSDFDKDKGEKCFSVDQIWACYDTIDGMPRFYAQVKKVFSHAFKLKITWLEADPEEQGEIDWVKEGLPVGCGKFIRGDTEVTSDCLSFSHLIYFEKGIGRGSYMIYPRMGETWALFKDWDIGWSTDSENHKKYIFEIVEILSDFSHDAGINVGYLRKMKGFVSLFKRTTRGGVGTFLVPSSELLRFSHRIPSFKMTGIEREGVPVGSLELDTAALPTNPKELWQPEEEKEKEVEAQSMNVNVNGSSSKSSDEKERSRIGSENTSTPKCVDFEGKNYVNKEVEKLLRSPWELNSTIKKSVRANSVPCVSQEETAKHLNGSKNQTGDFTPSKRKASSSQGDEEIHIGMAKSSIDLTESPGACPSFSVGARVSEEVFYDFNMDKSVGKFQPGQIWALYSSTEKFPNSYSQIKKIEPSPFKLYAVLLEPCTFKQPVCCGMFKVPNGKPKVFSPSSFSHLMSEESISKIKHEIYPKEGEIWAIYKNWNAELSCPDMKNCEFDIVEVLKANEFCTEVSSLVHLPGFKSVFKAQRKRSNTGLLTIPRGDLFRFSHRIPAFQLTSEKDGYLRGCWELDPAALPSDMLCKKQDG